MIKLGGDPAAAQRIKNAIDAFSEGKSFQHPFVIMPNGSAKVEIKAFNDALVISGIYVAPEARGRGIGSAILDEILSVADSYAVKCSLFATPYGQDSGLNEIALTTWYQRRGFVLDSRQGMLIREPGLAIQKDRSTAP